MPGAAPGLGVSSTTWAGTGSSSTTSGACFGIETVINRPYRFRVLRRVKGPRGRERLRWMRMSKGIANLWRYVEIGEQANRR